MFGDAMMAGDADRALSFAQADDASKQFVAAFASVVRAFSKLKQSAARELGDSGERVVSAAYHPQFSIEVQASTVVTGNMAVMKSSKPPYGELRFIRVGNEWKVELTSSWFEKVTQASGQPIEYYTKVQDTAAYEFYRIRDLLDSGQIRSTGQLRQEIHRSFRALAAFQAAIATTKPSTFPSTSQ